MRNGTQMRRETFKLAVMCLIISLPLAASSCGGGGSRSVEQTAAAMTGGFPARGREKIRKYGCSSCHTIPGIPEADSTVGPPLQKMSGRTYIAGVLENNPQNMTRWIRDPQGVDSLTAMPNLGVTEEDARDIAAYLYTLK
jgi:cytochrome c